MYPFGKSSFTQYDDDGYTEKYKRGEGVSTLIESAADKDVAHITVYAAKGGFAGFEKTRQRSSASM